MTRRRTGGYVRTGDEMVDRGCAHCGWYAVAGSYPELVDQYHSHLRDEHPKAWLRA